MNICNFYDTQKNQACTKIGKTRTDCFGRRLCSEHQEKYKEILHQYESDFE